MNIEGATFPDKLEPPVEGVVMRRPRLAWSRPKAGDITVLRAPIGFGKSTLLAQWYQDARKNGIRVVWISLSNPVSNPEKPLASSKLVSHFRNLRNQGADQIFIDDWSAISGTPMETMLADEILHDTRCAYVIATRKPVRLPERTLLRTDRLRTLGQADLAFTAYEQRRLLGTKGSHQVSDDLIDACRGWPLAIKMAAQRASEYPKDRVTVTTFLHLTSFQRILSSELIDACSLREQNFLNTLGLSQTIDPHFLDHVRMATDSGPLLEQITCLLPFEMRDCEPHSSFDAYGLTYLLLQRRFDRLPVKKRTLLALRGSDFAAGRQQLIRAIDFALVANQPERAIKLAENAGPMKLMMIYGIIPLQVMLRRLPEELLARSYRLTLLDSLLYSKQGCLTEAREMIKKSLEVLTTDQSFDTPEALDALFAKTQLAVYSDALWIDEFETTARLQLARDPAFAGWGRLCSGIVAHQLGQTRKADLEFAKANSIFRSFGASYQMLHMHLHDAHVKLARGDLSAAGKLFREVKDSARRQYSFDHGLRSAAEIGHLIVCLETSPATIEPGQLTDALFRLQESESWFEPFASALISFTRTLRHQEGTECVLEMLAEIQQQMSTKLVTHVAGVLRLLQVQYRFLAGEDPIRIGSGQATDQIDLSVEPRFWRERYLHAAIRAMLAENSGDLSLALRILDEAVSHSRNLGLRLAELDLKLRRLDLTYRAVVPHGVV